MTKTSCAVLAAVLGLTTATLHAAEPPEFLTLPPSEIKLTPLPLDTKAPLPGAYGPACYPHTGACSPCNTCCSSQCNTSCGLGLGLGQWLQDLGDFADRDHPKMDKFFDWLTYRPCHLASPGCCYYVRPAPAGYEWFLHPGCVEGSCGGCCKTAAPCSSCKTAAPCGSCGSCNSCAH
jgi:hypothetical protein